MNKILIFLITFTFISCSVDEVIQASGNDNGEILTVDIPNELTFGETYIFETSVASLTTCHSFNQFKTELSSDSNTVIVGAILAYSGNINSCQPTNTVFVKEFEYTVDIEDNITFKFISSFNNNGSRNFITKEVTVINP